MRRRSPIAFPFPHFMAFAPLDAWARMLLYPAAWTPPAYWLRLAFGLFCSALATALTLPERLVLWPLLAAGSRRTGARLDHGPGIVVILGYFRSGTTHLHYVLSCDPRFRTPRWCETLAPQGFVLSWLFLRVFMIPFLGAKRPQDDVSIGPDWPAEDDFALNNWAAASSLVGRFVLPQKHAYYDRFHSLVGLSPREHARWRRAQWAFCRKVAWLAGERALLLKSPSHTGRARELVDLFGAERVRFVHISREPSAVVRSNVHMEERLSRYNLQDPAPGDDVERRLAMEYLDTEQRFLNDAPTIAPGHLSRVRYEDLVADPLAELRRVYSELGLKWTAEFERRVNVYLDTVRDYKPATAPTAAGQPSNPEGGDATQELSQIARDFGHDRPARPKAPLSEVPEEHRRTRRAVAATVGALVAVVCAALWIAQAWFLCNRHDWLAWPTGVLIGLATLRAARVGSVGLGVWAAALTVVVFALISVPATFLSDYAHRTSPPFPVGYRGLPMRNWEWYHILKASRVGSLAQNNLFWLFMGVVTAYRFASRKFVFPPGRG
jgi:omega-hydroxy-beta-dihydromenaquinone-9 sulfotransferase